ncbi:NAD-dependent epimerase/dehydratase family protein [Alsobacter sp. R-9]
MALTYAITGGAGFIGRHLCENLIAAGHHVRILDCLVPQVHGADPPALPDGASLILGDVRDPGAVREAVSGVDGVFHLAAEVGVGQSMYEIERYVGANDLGTAVLLQTLIASPVPRIVVASSMSVYGEGRYRDAAGRPVPSARRRGEDVQAGRWEPVSPDGEALLPIPTDEDKPVDLASIYALTKYVQERAVMLFGEAYRVDAVALRLFNVHGPGQALGNPYTGVLANFAARLAAGERPMVFEDGLQRRDFVHVADVAEAFRLAMESPRAPGHVFNIGSGQSHAIADVARALASAMGREIEPEILRRARAGDIRHCFADIAKARDLLGYAPQRRLVDTLGELATWVASQSPVDRGAEMRRQLEARGLVS